MQPAAQGSYAIGWDQVTLEGASGAGMDACRPGIGWRWTGRALRLIGAPGVLRLGETHEAADLRRRARRGAARFVAIPMAVEAEDGLMAGPAITVTDGRRSWRVDLLPPRHGGRGIAHFPALPPPAGVNLWIARVDGGDRLDTAPGRDVWHGMAAGTLVETPGGPVAIERIGPGMAVLTADGAVTVLRREAREVSGARLCVTPDLTPVRIGPGALGRGEPGRVLTVAPDQGVVLDGPEVRALYPQGPVVARARDLAEGAGIVRARGLPGMVGHVLVLARPAAVLAEGLTLACDGLEARVLTQGEVAILRRG
jgi:hypothetical protein